MTTLIKTIKQKIFAIEPNRAVSPLKKSLIKRVEWWQIDNRT